MLRFEGSRLPEFLKPYIPPGVLPLTREGSLFDALPEAFGSYRVIEGLGDGRFGPVYRGRDEATGVAVAIKLFDQGLTSDQAARVAGMLERLTQAPLEHPGIVPIVAAGAEGHRVWITERWLDATPLDSLMRRDLAQSAADAVVRVTQLAGALDFAAAVDFHHGALHPRDILMSGELTALAGIGVLQALGDAGLAVPMEGAYVSPHRARGLPPTRADDIFSLAAITYELIYGSPVPARSELRGGVASLAGVDRARLASILESALSPDPDDRPPTALAFAAALQEALTPIEIPNPIPVPTPIPIPHSEAPAADFPLRESAVHGESTERIQIEEIREIREKSPIPDPRPDPPVHAAKPTREPAPDRGYWFLTTATLAIGLLIGFASGYVTGQRDAAPGRQSAERAIARAQRPPSSGEETTAPTSGRDFTESAVPPAASGVEGGGPPSSEPAGSERSPRTDAVARDPVDAREPGVLQVDSRPRGAQVFLDGRLVGTTPLLLTDVRPGTHAVRIDLRGHRRWVTSVELAAGERQRVAASLER